VVVREGEAYYSDPGFERLAEAVRGGEVQNINCGHEIEYN
jgi:hypothetical protein